MHAHTFRYATTHNTNDNPTNQIEYVSFAAGTIIATFNKRIFQLFSSKEKAKYTHLPTRKREQLFIILSTNPFGFSMNVSFLSLSLIKFVFCVMRNNVLS